MNEQELNKKLAEWAGLHWAGKYWEETQVEYPPYFTKSLDACFKWLPIPYIKVWKDADCDGKVFYMAVITMDGLKFYDASNDNEPALALCLAVEKLIDSEVNNE